MGPASYGSPETQGHDQALISVPSGGSAKHVQRITATVEIPTQSRHFPTLQQLGNPSSRPARVRNLRHGQLVSPTYGVLINTEVWLAVIQVLVAQDGLHRLHIAGRSQYASRKGAPPTVRTAELEPRLAVEPADRLLESITGPVHLGAALKLAPLECQLEGLALVGHHQARAGPQTPVLKHGADTPSAPQAHANPLLDGFQAIRLGQVDIACPAALGYFGPQVHLRPDHPAGVEHVSHLQQGQLGHANAGRMGQYSSITSRSGMRPVTDATRIRWRNWLGRRDAARRVAIGDLCQDWTGIEVDPERVGSGPPD